MADLIGDRYEVLGALDDGHETEILRAVDRRHDRSVALRIRPFAGDDDRASLLRGGRTLLGLQSHPALPTVRDDFFVDDRYVLVMDWIEGTDLGRILREQGDPGLAVGLVLAWLPAVASALDHLHAHHPPVAHGDVRPDNIVVAPNGHAALVFGAAPLDASPGAAASGLRAPELADGAPLQPAADVFALAATAVCLLTGQPPTPGEPITWEGVAPELAKRLDRAVRRALDPDPARRPATAERLIDRLTAAREGALPTGVVTFVLTDIEGSTRLWEAHPEVMASVIARHHALAADSAEDHRGHMPRSQGEGDSSLSAFGRATDAVAAALSFQRALATEPWPDGIQLRARAGMHTGEAQVDRGDYFGSAVNRAARVRGLAAGGQVLLSRATAELVTDNLPDGATLQDLGSHALKGLARDEHVYELCAADLPRPAADAPASMSASGVPVGLAFPVGLDVGAGRFVGREADLSVLDDAWKRMIERPKRHVVLVAGEPGIGKSSLTAEFARRVAAHDATVLYGRSYTENLLPYQPFVEAIGQYLRTGPAARVQANLMRTGTNLTRLVPGITVRFPALPAPVHAEPDTERYLMFDAVNQLLVDLSTHAPVLVLLEDLHWADRPTLALLAHLARGSEAAPILVLGTYRTSEVVDDHPLAATIADLRTDRVLREVSLSGMDEDEVGRLVASSCELTPGPGFVRSLRDETDGNPFFVEEICRHVAETGANTGAFTLDALGVPDGVKQVIARRVGHLDPSAARVLSVAAVIGRDFELKILAEAAGVDEDDVLDLLDEACARQLIEETGPVGRYSFVHALTREALYGSLSTTRRARLHQRVAGAIESHHASELDERLGALAYHYAAAGSDIAKAVDYAARAGAQALDRLAHEEAAVQFERGLELLTKHDAARCDLLLGLAEARRRAGDVSGSQALFAQAGALARSIGDAERLARAAVGNFRGHVLAHPGWHDEVIELLEAALGALSAEDSILRCRALAALALELHFTSQRVRGVAVSGASIDMARRLGDDGALAFALACSHTATSDPDHVQARLDGSTELVGLGDGAGNPELALVGHVHRACDLLQLARVDEARKEAAICAAVVEELGQPMQRYFVIWLESTLALLEGRLDDAERLSNEALSIGLAADHPDAMVVFGTQAAVFGWQRGDTSSLLEPARELLREFPDLSAWPAALALVEAVAGQTVEASKLLDQSVSDLDAIDFGAIWTPAMVSLSEVCRILTDRKAAAAIYERLEPYAGTLCVVSLNLSEMGPVSRALGVLATLTGDFSRAAEHFEDALATSERIGAPPHIARTKVDLARLLLARQGAGDREQATSLLAQGAELADRLGMAGLLRDCRDMQRG